MGKTHEKVIEAFKNKLSKKVTNTKSTGEKLYLFDNCIAKWIDNEIYIRFGYFKLSATTKNRLSLLGANLKTKNGVHYKDSVVWDGSWIKINEKPKEIKKETLWN